MRRGLALAVVAASLAVVPAGSSAAPRKARLASFPKCSTFVHYARRHALRELKTMGGPVVGSPFPAPTTRGGPGAEGAPQSVSAPQADTQGDDFSGTNVQEAGVDEPDLVKTDGKRMFVASGGRLFSIDPRSSPPKLLDSVELQGTGHQLLMAGDKLLVLAGGYGVTYTDVVVGAPGPVRAASPMVVGGDSTLMEVDVEDPADLKIRRTLSVNGGYLDARLTGHVARIVFSAIPQAIPLLGVAQPEERPEKVGRTTTPSWRPTYVLRRGVRGRASRHALVRCTSIRRPVEFSGLNSLTVLTIDIDKGLDPIDSDAVITDAQTVYASKKNLYIATQKAVVEQPDSQQPPDLDTQIHKFDISDPGRTTYLGSGAVIGTLLNQFSMSEQDGFLRVASTNSPLWWSAGTNRPSQSYVTVLAERGGVLAQVGRVGGLGQGERIYAVRFLGDVGYVVTFRQTDPLYTVGLSDPEKPRVLGELHLLGYSAYLHPVGEGLLLGVGQDASEEGRVQGTQLSLFDVSDPAKPARLSSKALGSGASSSAEFDHHAFLWWARSKLAVIPVQIYTYDEQKGTSDQFSGAIGFHVAKADPIAETGRVTHPAAQGGYQVPIDRSLVVGQRLFTISYLGVKASDLGTFADRGFVDFPQPEPGTGGGGGGSVPPGDTVSSPPSR